MPEDAELRLAEIVLNAAALNGAERENYLRDTALHNPDLEAEPCRRQCKTW